MSCSVMTFKEHLDNLKAESNTYSDYQSNIEEKHNSAEPSKDDTVEIQ